VDIGQHEPPRFHWVFHDSKRRFPEALERLVQLYEATDKKDEAAKWSKELDAIRTAVKKSKKKR
jgi:hypothetical protein